VARGESEQSSERGVGIAIFAVFLVVCALVAWVVADAVRPEPPLATTAVSHRNWNAILGSVHGRGCTPITPGLTVGPSSPAVTIERELTTRGYVAVDPAWSEPLGYPTTVRATGLDGACGVLAFLAQDGVVNGVGADPANLAPPCRGELATFAICGEDTPVLVQGWGQVRSRVFAIPGLDRGAAEATGLPIEALLSHVEAEMLLARSGWRASATVWKSEQPAGSPIAMPPAPTTECEPWIVVGLGVENATSYFEGVQLAHELGPRRFVVPVVRCPGTTGELQYDTSRSGTLYWRRFQEGVAPPRIGSPTLGALPRAVDDVTALAPP
jgi:hypothetical protein